MVEVVKRGIKKLKNLMEYKGEMMVNEDEMLE